MMYMSHSGSSGKGKDDDEDPEKQLPLKSTHEQSGDEVIFEAALAAVALFKAARALEKAPITDLGAIEHCMAQVLEIWEGSPLLKTMGPLALVPPGNHQLQGYKNISGLIQKLTMSTESVCNEEAGGALRNAAMTILQNLYREVSEKNLATLKRKVMEGMK
jgi:hypothetical protein